MFDIIRDNKLKSPRAITTHLSEWKKIVPPPNPGQDMGELGESDTAGVISNGTTTLENAGSFFKSSICSHHTTEQLRSWTFLPEKVMCAPHKNLYLNADTALFISTRDWKQPTRPSRDERSNKFVHPCHGEGLNERTGLPICAATWT